jgi:hypothetical protein
MSRAIMAYRLDGNVLLVPLARLATGGHVESEPVRVCPEAEDPQRIGAALIETLQDAGRMVPAAPAQSIAQAASGASSWTAFVTKARACDISQEPDGYSISTLRRDGAAFLYTGQPLKLPLETSPDALARHVLAALDPDE